MDNWVVLKSAGCDGCARDLALIHFMSPFIGYLWAIFNLRYQKTVDSATNSLECVWVPLNMSHNQQYNDNFIHIAVKIEQVQQQKQPQYE